MLLGSEFAHGPPPNPPPATRHPPPNDKACENLVAAVLGLSICACAKSFTKFTRQHLLQVRISVKLQVKNKTQVNYYKFNNIFKTAFDKGNLK